jgi:hypothetical protein
MTIVKGTNNEDRMEKISESKIQKVDQIESEDHGDELNEEELEAELEKMEEAIANDGVGNISKPQVTLRFRSARFTHLWDLNATNDNCLCEKKVTMPTESDLQKRATYSNYMVSRCGCAYHSSCIKAYVTSLGDVDANMINCPICRTKYEPLPNQTTDAGVYEAVTN